ncbi:hypothetical protein [Photorhabdus heterorhabditis]|uniref:hypothetical protein n=1 Tax=Photorhabdus heterorhabditis TaxID=880156 RepID=UPI001561E78B|nr:hypothetical protein [Photorhabdus heterorhabditis]NRN29085.1 hypothetical protein [Photorhabdus heterorhabditis subsp. aluminescens]
MIDLYVFLFWRSWVSLIGDRKQILLMPETRYLEAETLSFYFFQIKTIDYDFNSNVGT